jgi:cyclic pyranopterin phosphate synthase
VKPSHLDPEGAPRMVDISDKPVTARRALAAATVRMRPEVLATLLDGAGAKGDAFVTARLAGIAAAKRTADLIPLCHPLPIDHVDVDLAGDRERGEVRITAEVRATARTGVEMEALTAASIAALTLYDMAKALQRDISIEQVQLLHKQGGRSGSWTRGAGTQDAATAAQGEASAARSGDAEAESREAAVVTCSNRSAA